MADYVDAGGARAKAYDTLVSLLDRFNAGVSYRAAVAGDGAGNVEVTGERRIYARLGSSDGELVEAMFDAFIPANDDSIFLRREQGAGLGGWMLAGWLAGVDVPCVDGATRE